MAIFGDLIDMPFIEVLNMLKSKSGVLILERFNGYPRVDFHLYNSEILGIVHHLQVVKDLEEAQKILIEQVRREQGGFEFQHRHSSALITNLSNLSIETLVQYLPVAEDFQSIMLNLPESETRFIGW